ncbi:MAG: glycosyltransferase family 2 protein [Mycobacteriales bacterium]
MTAPDRACEEPSVSVCVSTRDRAGSLPKLIASLERQRLDPARFEVVVVDDGSVDATASVLDSLRQESPLQLRQLRNDCPCGPAAGRNRAWRAARAPVIAFTDDDCEPSPNWLTAGLRAVNNSMVVAIGRVMPNQRQLGLLEPFSYTVWVDEGQLFWFPTANLFCRRQDLEAVGGFDESIWRGGPPTSEDTDLGLRMLDLGAQAVFVTEALVYHDVHPKSLLALLADQSRWSDIPGLIARHPWARRQLLAHGLFWKSSHARLLLALAGVVLSTRDPRSLLLATPWIHGRTCLYPLSERTSSAWLRLPAAAVLDIAETVQMIRGSARHRTLVL